MITRYKEWNTALWNYFFPEGNEDPVLAIDENLLKEIGERAGIRCEGSSWKDDFLRKTLIPEENFRELRNDWRIAIGGNCDSQRWDDLVEFLMNRSFDGVPAYFAMLCAIMVLAGSIDGRVTHGLILEAAKEYLGDNYRGKVGQFVDDLLQKLHRNQPSFNPDKMDVSQRNMSRIKYHLVLKASERRDFIDFLEVGNYRWEEGPYADYANKILIPALHRANKDQRFFEIVKEPEYIPYVKNILQSNLQWGKMPEASVSNNTRQIRDIRWKYEMELDYDGNPSFYISTDSYLPFGIILDNNQFLQTEEISDYIAYNVQLTLFAPSRFTHDAYDYCFINLAQGEEGDWDQELFFQQVDDRYYHQVERPIEGKHYLKIIRNRAQNIERLARGWKTSDITVEGFIIYEIDSYIAPRGNRNVANNTDNVRDLFALYGLGTWFSIYLDTGQKLYWDPEEVDAEEVPINNIINAPNGKKYFRIPRKITGNFLRGNLFVRDNRGNNLLSEHIKRYFLWDGRNMKYGYNAWGEVIEGGTIQRVEARPTERVILPLQENMISHDPLSRDSNMLIQILYDIADEDGCVSQRKMVEALKFVLDFHQVDPSKEKIKNRLIFALRRLGYIVALKVNGVFVNQLIAPYLELTNYGIMDRNAYLVKGIYSTEALQAILNDLPTNGRGLPIKYKRPISREWGDEYECLPDMILFATDQPTGIWDIVNHPVAYDLLAAIADMRDFEHKFSINEGGDELITNVPMNTPCMMNTNGEEYLCIQRDGRYYKHKYYFSDGVFKPVLKHLSRVYCQNKHDQPIVILKTQRVRGQIRVDYDHISIIKGMGKPTLFDIALCDLNLGIPSDVFMFVLNSDTSSLPRNNSKSYSRGNVYSTNGFQSDRGLMVRALEKVGARRINDPLNSTTVFISAPRSNYSMKIADVTSHKISLGVFFQGLLNAFSVGSSVYVWNPARDQFEEIEGGSVNQKLSSVMNGTYHSNGNRHEGAIPSFDGDKSRDVSIIRNLQ